MFEKKENWSTQRLKITVIAAEYNLFYIEQIKFTQPEANY